MTTLKFRSNIKCADCVAKVTPFLNEAEGIRKWKVNFRSPENTLTVKTDQLWAEEIERIVKNAGFEAENRKELTDYFD